MKTIAQQIKDVYSQQVKAAESYKAITDILIEDIRTKGMFETARAQFKTWPTNDKAKLMGSSESIKFAQTPDCKADIKLMINAVNAFCVWYSRNKQLFMTPEEVEKAQLAKKRTAQQRAAKADSTTVEETTEAKTTSNTCPLGEAIQALEANGYKVLSRNEFDTICKNEREAREAFQSSREVVKSLKARIAELEAQLKPATKTAKPAKAVATC